jgi:hypothetical protein
MACSRLRNGTTFGTNWGSGGVQRSTDYGDTWPDVSSVDAAWGVAIAGDDPNCTIFGVYSGGTTYLSIDGGNTFLTQALTGSNYSFFLRDRGCILAEQSGGIYKMTFTYGLATTAAPVSGRDGAAFGLRTVPNPFQRTTRIHYTLPVRARIELEVFDVRGQRVATLARGVQEPGSFAQTFTPRSGSLAAGVYFVRLKAGASSSTAKILLLE